MPQSNEIAFRQSHDSDFKNYVVIRPFVKLPAQPQGSVAALASDRRSHLLNIEENWHQERANRIANAAEPAAADRILWISPSHRADVDNGEFDDFAGLRFREMVEISS